MRILGIADATYVHTLKWANGIARRGHPIHLVSWWGSPPRRCPIGPKSSPTPNRWSPGVPRRHPGRAAR